MTRRAGKDLSDLLSDLVIWGEKVERVAGRTSRETIGEDEQAELALARAIEVVGEIAGRLLTKFPEWCRERNEEDLSDAYRMRNRLAHGYDHVTAEVLHDIAMRHVPELTEQARLWLADICRDQP